MEPTEHEAPEAQEAQEAQEARAAPDAAQEHAAQDAAPDAAPLVGPSVVRKARCYLQRRGRLRDSELAGKEAEQRGCDARGRCRVLVRGRTDATSAEV